MKGSASANENPNIPTTGAIPPLLAASTINVPTIGPVQENETSANTSAIKNIPIIPPLSAFESALFTHLFGKRISNAPMNEKAKITNRTKKKILNHGFVDISLRTEAPNTAVTTVPSKM